jgi:hypothetical protein
MKPTTVLSAPDDYGTRWSYDRTISVHHDPGGYTVYDTLRRVTHARQSLHQARQITRQILDARPQLDWLRSWKLATGRDGRVWERVSSDYATVIRVVHDVHDDNDVNPGFWRIEIDINGDGRSRSYGWLVEAHHGIGPIKAQALAWAAYRASDEESA